MLELELGVEELGGDDEDDGGVDDGVDDTLDGGVESGAELADCDPEDGVDESIEDCELDPDCELPASDTDAETLLLPPS